MTGSCVVNPSRRLLVVAVRRRASTSAVSSMMARAGEAAETTPLRIGPVPHDTHQRHSARSLGHQTLRKHAQFKVLGPGMLHGIATAPTRFSRSRDEGVVGLDRAARRDVRVGVTYGPTWPLRSRLLRAPQSGLVAAHLQSCAARPGTHGRAWTRESPTACGLRDRDYKVRPADRASARSPHVSGSCGQSGASAW